jgi:cytosine/uracil/thiamine/allantoin permease
MTANSVAPNSGGTQRDFEELQTDVSHSPLWNADLAPTTIKERTWTTWNIGSLDWNECGDHYLHTCGRLY